MPSPTERRKLQAIKMLLKTPSILYHLINHHFLLAEIYAHSKNTYYNIYVKLKLKQKYSLATETSINTI